VEDPLNTDNIQKFRLGFALVEKNFNENTIQYFRIQNLLRRMGLGRRALKELVNKFITEPRGQSGLDLIKISDWALKNPKGNYFIRSLNQSKPKLANAILMHRKSDVKRVLCDQWGIK
jgi:hypothetical protein